MGEMMFYDLTKRSLVSLVAIATISLLIFFSPVIYVQWLIVVVLALIAGVGLYEYATLSQLEHKYDLACLGALIVVAEPFNLHYWVLAVASLFLFVRQFGNIEKGFSEVSGGVFGLIYVVLPLTMVMSLLAAGRWWVVYLLVVTKSVDTFAYFAGRCFGKRKLAPQLSPSKTLEGAVVGFLSAIVVSAGFSAFHLLPFKESLLLGGVIGIVAQLGDLAESLLKRSVGAKDSNRLPGLGGILDMIDSLLFTIPLLYLYLFL
jgi:phosphatidate cytidylyltransferase